MAETTAVDESKEKQVKVPILTKIQNELKAPKNQENTFGHYNYRTAEDIESAVKPLLLKYGASLYFDEEIKQLGDRYYIVEIARYKDSEQEIVVHGHARESLTKKGMDDSQVSGAAESYAAKYALGKLFLIDDTKDADAMDNRNYKPTKAHESNSQRLAKAKQFTVQYGGGNEKLVDIIKWSNQGNEQATKFLDVWRQRSKANEASYQFIVKNKLAS